MTKESCLTHVVMYYESLKFKLNSKKCNPTRTLIIIDLKKN